MKVAVGKDVEAVCRKCGEVWHVIVSMDAGGVITKVQCKECSGLHRYKAPDGEERVDAKAAKKPAAKATTASKRKSTKKKARRLSSLPDAPLVEPDTSRPVKDYSIRETFTLGDRIDHPKFGHGVVEALPGPGKCSVFFEDGRRTLAHDR